MNEIVDNKFNEWFERECANGLVDLKISIRDNTNTIIQSIKEEILNMEALVDAGRVISLPMATNSIPQDVLSEIKSFTTD